MASVLEEASDASKVESPTEPGPESEPEPRRDPEPEQRSNEEPHGNVASAREPCLVPQSDIIALSSSEQSASAVQASAGSRCEATASRLAFLSALAHVAGRPAEFELADGSSVSAAELVAVRPPPPDVELNGDEPLAIVRGLQTPLGEASRAVLRVLDAVSFSVPLDVGTAVRTAETGTGDAGQGA